MPDITAINSFASDNASCACPEVMQALVDANIGIADSYGEDGYSINLERKFSELFETEVIVFPVVSGTAANALSLAALTPSYGKVFCHAMSHINTDECAAPEFFTGGAKLIPINSDDGKIDVDSFSKSIRGAGNVHAAQPSTVSITQACETGTVYQLDEIALIAELAHRNNLNVHMDGARFANALVSLGCTPAEMTWKSGIDVLSFGGTKNGCLAAEAVVFFKSELASTFPFLHKRAGQLLSKMRFVSAQLEAYIKDDIWLRNARHANSQATLLSEALSAVPGISLAYPVQSNEIFVHLPSAVIQRLNATGFNVAEEELDGTAPPRFVTAWNTQNEEIDKLAAAVSAAML